MTSDLNWKLTASFVVLIAQVACGGGGGGGSPSGGGGTTNRAPVANAGADQSVDEQINVVLDGSGSTDPDGDSLSYSWMQSDGTSVTLADASSSQASFSGPNVGIGSNTTLTFTLRATDTSGAVNTDTVDIVVNGVSNTEPVVDSGADQATTSAATVILSGIATDGDIGDVLAYSWTQLSGTAVTIADSDMANASFAAPNVAAGSETLTFQLAVNDGTTTVTDTMDVTVSPSAAVVSLSGIVQYEYVPARANCNGLDFNAIQARPIRAATVQLIDDATGNVLATQAVPDSGNYSFSNVSGNLDVRIRIRAELKRTGTPGWDVEVRDNVDTSPNPAPLGSRPLYVYEETFNTGGADLVRDITATTGWDGSAYSGVRAAAPFAILDAIYTGMQLVMTVDADTVFAPMDAFWSVNNTRTDQYDFDIGELASTAYFDSLNSLFLLGDANIDTEEFDDDVVMHEWGHYFEDNFSRADSIGGRHVFGSSLDARLAFGEGFATAIAAIALDDAEACNTQAPIETSGFRINVESFNSGAQGWFNEGSVATLLYDLWDTGVDGTDTDSIGFGPIFDTLTGPQKDTEAFTTIFSFAAELRPMLNAAQQAFVDSQLGRENIESANIDIWGSTQGSNMAFPNQARDVLPLYTTLPTDGSVINICANSDYESERDGNKLAEYRFLRITTTSSAAYTVNIATTTATPATMDPDDRDQSDPDMFIFRRGQEIIRGISGDENLEVFITPTMAADTYIADLREFRFADDLENGTPDSFPEQICFDVSMTPL